MGGICWRWELGSGRGVVGGVVRGLKVLGKALYTREQVTC